MKRCIEATLPIDRTCDGESCGLCSKSISSETKAVVVTVPVKRLQRLAPKTKSAFTIPWDISRTTNAFHEECWRNAIEKKTVGTEERLVASVIESVETYDGSDYLRERAKEVAALMKKSKHSVCFTGAGISASAGIPTYRGAEGIDTLESHQVSSTDQVDYTALQPTLSHKAIVKLFEMGYIKYVMTQNCDDLHAKAGLPRAAIADLHGNVFIETCEQCQKEYIRDYEVDAYSTDCYNESWYVKCKSCKWNHYTGRHCDDCGGKLIDTIINFGDDLSESIMARSQKEVKKSEVCLCIGSTLSVFPANELPTAAASIVIVNPQPTDLDDKAHIRIWSSADDFFVLLLNELNC